MESVKKTYLHNDGQYPSRTSFIQSAASEPPLLVTGHSGFGPRLAGLLAVGLR